MNKAQMRAAVRRGVKLLNEKRPTWFTKINTKKLDLGDCGICVLGQLYHDPRSEDDGYYRGLQILNGKVAEDPTRFGFEFAEWDDNAYEELTQIWREEIAAQRRLYRARKTASNA